MPTFPRGTSSRTVWTHNQTIIATSTKPTATTSPGQLHYHTPADNLTLRGIPAIGRGVAGHIPGTRPDTHTT